jgi:predicted kinase
MEGRHLIIICGVPGAGKSTLALRAVDRWGAVSFASENFTDELGAAARTPSGDLSEQAIVHAYAAMAAAAAAALATKRLVLTVGSFRAEDQRSRFRNIARSADAPVTTLRIVCPVEIAAKRVQSRLASGERGPTEKVIQKIDVELSCANDIDAVLNNDTSIESFYRQIDTTLGLLV